MCTEKDEQLKALDKEGGTRVFVTEALYQALDADKKKNLKSYCPFILAFVKALYRGLCLFCVLFLFLLL